MAREGKARRSMVGLISLSLLLLVFIVQLPGGSGAPVCTTPNSKTEIVNAFGVCDCEAGWVGPECNICQTDDVCNAGKIDEEIGPRRCANESFAAVKKQNGWCKAASQQISDLLDGTGWVAFSYNESKVFSFEFFKQSTANNYISLFKCISKQAEQLYDPARKEVKITSPEVKCEMTCPLRSDSVCTPFLAGAVAEVGSAKDMNIVCSNADGTCRVSENTLNTFFDGGVKTDVCLHSECLQTTEEGNGVQIGDFTTRIVSSKFEQATAVLGFMSIGLILFMSVVAAVGFFASFKYPSHAKTVNLIEGMAVNQMVGAAEKGIRVVFRNIHYAIKTKVVLNNVNGIAYPGELTAIMGPSGSGKTSFLDILARKKKSGKLLC